MAMKKYTSKQRGGSQKVRSSWRGALSFSLVSFSVDAVNARDVRAGEIHFHQIHAECHNRIHYQKVCPVHGEVPNDEIVSGYEFKKGKYVELDPEELAKLRPQSDRALKIDAFVHAGTIDPLYFDGRMYYLIPGDAAGQEPYAVILEAMKREQYDGIGHLIFSGKDQIALIRPLDNVLQMAMLTYKSEIRSPAQAGAEFKKPANSLRKVQLAQKLLEASLQEDFDLSQYEDEYRDKVKELIDSKLRGHEVVEPQEERPRKCSVCWMLSRKVCKNGPLPGSTNAVKTVSPREDLYLFRAWDKPMTASPEATTTSFWHELRDILCNAREAWRLVAHRERLFLGGAALLMGLVSACNTAFPLLLGQMLNHIKAGTAGAAAPTDLYETALKFLFLIGAIFLAREIIQFVRQFLIENACSRIKKNMTIELFTHLIKFELSKVSQDKIGALHSRITRCVGEFVRFIKLAFLDFFPPLLTGAFALAAGLTKEPLLGLAMALVIPLSLYLTVRQIRSQNGIRRAMIRSQDELSGIVVEQLNGLEYVRAANTHDYEIRRVADASERHRAMEKRHHTQMSMFSSAKAINEAFFHLLVISLATYLAIRGSLDYGDILTYSFLFANVMAPLNEIHRSLDSGHECSLMVSELVDMLNEPPDRSFVTTAAQEPKPAPGQPILVTRDLVVEFNSELGRKRALNGINMVINHGETIGLAGPSGCGKTTWLRILLRLIHPDSGTVQIAGVPIESVSRAAIGQLIGYVSQAPFVFAGTIEENIRYGTPGACMETIQDAAQRACIHDEIMAMPAGYQTTLSERGLNLSTGQRQRLALAHFSQGPARSHSRRGHLRPGQYQRTQRSKSHRPGSERPHGNPCCPPSVDAARTRIASTFFGMGKSSKSAPITNFFNRMAISPSLSTARMSALPPSLVRFRLFRFAVNTRLQAQLSKVYLF